MIDANWIAGILVVVIVALSLIAMSAVTRELITGSYKRYMEKRTLHLQQLHRIQKKLGKDEVMNDMSRNIREFIYLDVPKLYSLYSQVFEGIADRIIEERINELMTGDTQAPILKEASTEARGFEVFRRVESGILHDHMYTRLEQQMGETLLDGSKVDITGLKSALAENPLIRIAGRAEVEDYERLGVFINRFNELGEAIAYSTISGNPEFQKEIDSIRQKADKTKGKEFETELSMYLKNLAAKLGLSQDPRLLNNIKFFGEVFNPNGYDVVITPSDKPNLHYRAVLDRTWLRYEPQLIRHWYGGQSEAPWCVVGIITHVPGTYKDLTEAATVGSQEKSSLDEHDAAANPMMLDAYRNLFRTARGFERMLLESDTATEIVVSPLAIYREFQLGRSSRRAETETEQG